MALLNNKQLQFGFSPAQYLRFVMEENQAEVEIPAHHSMIVGRTVTDEQEVDVDLGPFGAYRRGVSRQHIRLEKRNGKWFITDLGSENGTWLNNLKIFPLVAYEVKNGSELRLGELYLSMFFS